MTLRPFIKRLKYILQIWDTSQYINSWRKCRNYYISRFVTPIDHRTSHVFAVYVYSCWFTLIYILSMQKFEYHQATLRNITDTQSFRFGSHFVIFHLKQFGKIILHRIISVVWITIFLSENRSRMQPCWWGVALTPERENDKDSSLRQSLSLMIANVPRM